MGPRAARCEGRADVRARQPLSPAPVPRARTTRPSADGLGRPLHALLAARRDARSELRRTPRRRRQRDHLAERARPAPDGRRRTWRARALRLVPAPTAAADARRRLPPDPRDDLCRPRRREVHAGVVRDAGAADALARELRQADGRRAARPHQRRTSPLHAVGARPRERRDATPPQRPDVPLLQRGRHLQPPVRQVRGAAGHRAHRLRRVAPPPVREPPARARRDVLRALA